MTTSVPSGIGLVVLVLPLAACGDVPVPTATPRSVPPSAAHASAMPDDVARGELVLRVEFAGGGPTDAATVVPEFSLMADGTVVWSPVIAPNDIASLVSRRLTADGLAELREHIFGSGLLNNSATHQLERRPDAGPPPGRGVGVYTFTAGSGVVVTSVQWLGDEEESTYYQPAPERRRLDALAQQLRDPEALLPGDAWAEPARAYEPPDYQLVLYPMRNFPPYQTIDVSRIPWPFDGSLEEYGVAVDDARTSAGRCGIITSQQAAAIIDVLVSAGMTANPSMASSASLDWADGNGVVDVFLLPRMPDGYPGCEDQP